MDLNKSKFYRDYNYIYSFFNYVMHIEIEKNKIDIIFFNH